ncbi:hypothetical protein SAMN04488564_10699 [Lentzea waywayandensis]|uniref:Uncharacterized protein n=1 Tax=Lentzea waywayandensis TaxID=84724 RepID=A0A1I6EWY9_9PSEU|nr:hypothetical protein [Lentzea waywayandensis]SFR22210.1 hypothetical protein SAMN04488564_10699 [Lentzea waywayandensis]
MVTISVGADDAGAEVRSLDQELVGVDELRGAVRLVVAEPGAGELGAIDSTLVVALGQGGAVTALVSVLVAWLRRRVGNVSVKLTKKDDTVIEVTAEHVRRLTGDQLMAFVKELNASLDEGEEK